MSTFTSYESTQQFATTGDALSIATGSVPIGEFTANIATNLVGITVQIQGVGGVQSGLYWWLYDVTSQTYVWGQPSAPNLLLSNGSGWTDATTTGSVALTAGHNYQIQAEWDESYTTQVQGMYDASASDISSDSYATWNSATTNGYPFHVAAIFEVPNNPPNPPTWDTITSNGSTINTGPHLAMSVSDPDTGDTIQNVEVQIATDSAFSNLVADDTYTNLPARFTGMPTTTNAASVVVYLNNNPNPVGTIYARSRATDNNGAVGSWSATQTYTIAAPPWTDTPSGYGMLASWLNDIQTVIDNAFAFRGWIGSYTPVDGTLSAQTQDVKAMHIYQRMLLLIAFQENDAEVVQPFTFSAPELGPAILNSNDFYNVCLAGFLWGTTQGMGGAWTPNGGGTLTYQTTTTPLGCSSAFTATNTYSAAQAMNVYTTNFGISPSTFYKVGVYVNLPSGLGATLALNFRDSSGNNLSAASISFTGTGGWQFVTAGGTSPSNAALIEWEIDCTVGSGVSYYVGPSMLTQGDPWATDRSGQHIIDLRSACAIT